MADPHDARRLAQQLVDQATPEERQALLDLLLGGPPPDIFDQLGRIETPTLLPIPDEVRRFRVRLDLYGAKPPIWRRLEVPGDLKLPGLHDVIQAAMGWTDSHLHRFRTGRDHRAAYFLTAFDVEEGDDGTLEDGVRLDQLVAKKGDEVWYEYDFGDGWEHRIRVEDVTEVAPDEPKAGPICIAGRGACPPEDCGGIGGYGELAEWVRSGYADAALPYHFENVEHARTWLPDDWHPDQFDLDETNSALASAAAEPVAVTAELATLADQLARHGNRALRQVLARPESHGPVTVSEADAARLTETYRSFLDVIGDGVSLTQAGKLPPSVAAEVADAIGLREWWRRPIRREDAVWPVGEIREIARGLGLVAVRKGTLAPTLVGLRVHRDPLAMLNHIAKRLPLGTHDADRQAGWMALAVAASGAPAEKWGEEVQELLYALGWRSGVDQFSPPPPSSPTMDVLQHLCGAVRVADFEIHGCDEAVAAFARSVIRAR